MELSVGNLGEYRFPPHLDDLTSPGGVVVLWSCSKRSVLALAGGFGLDADCTSCSRAALLRAIKASRRACSAGLNVAGFCDELEPHRPPNLGFGVVEFESGPSEESKETSEERKVRRSTEEAMIGAKAVSRFLAAKDGQPAPWLRESWSKEKDKN